MAEPERRGAVVVGAGLLGLSAGRSLARMGVDTVVLEQAAVGHARSGSRGASRIFRLGYEDPLYVRMAQRAGEWWRELEVESGRRILITTGQLDLGGGLDDLAGALQDAGAPYERWSRERAAERFPGLDPTGPVIWEPESGVLAAADALDALVEVSEAELRTGIEVTGLEDLGSGEGALVHTTAGLLHAASVIVCAGAFSRELLAAAGISLALTATREQIAYFGTLPGTGLSDLPIVLERPDVAAGRAGSGAGAGAHAGAHTGAGTVGEGAGAGPDAASGGGLVYGLPTPALGLYKLAFHHRGPVVDPAEAAMDPDPLTSAAVAAAAARLLPGLSPEVVASECCLYDNTPDEDFVLDRIGNIVIGSGTSGHGFKFGPLWGEILAALATGTTPPVDLVDLSRFSARRTGLWR